MFPVAGQRLKIFGINIDAAEHFTVAAHAAAHPPRLAAADFHEIRAQLHRSDIDAGGQRERHLQPFTVNPRHGRQCDFARQKFLRFGDQLLLVRKVADQFFERRHGFGMAVLFQQALAKPQLRFRGE